MLFGSQFRNQSPEHPDVANWFCFFQVICFFLYRMFDEMDGKQARRTQNSSPLGLLFDHGCDSLTVGFQIMIGAKLFQLGDTYYTMFAVTLGSLAFHFSTLEEYYTGGMFIGPGNAVSDGSVGIIILYCIMGFTGNDLFLHTIFKEGALWDGSPEVTGLFFFLLYVFTA